MTQELQQTSVDILSKLISYDSTSSKSNLDLISYIQSYPNELGIEHRLTYNHDKSKANLWATIGPTDRGGVVLSGHTDVVPIEGQVWRSDPFTMTHRDGKLFGRGSSDMKGFIACVLAHAPEFVAKPLTIPLHFAFSYDEEVGCLGVGNLIQDLRDNLPAPIAVIVGEPTSMKIVGGTKGGRGYLTRVTGIDGHSSLPDLGANAILAAAKIINYLEQMQQRLRDSADPSNGFIPPYTTLDLGTIKGGTAGNIIPAQCDFQWGFRGLPFEDMDALENEALSFMRDQVEVELKRVSTNTSILTETLSDVPALKPDENSPAEKIVRHLARLNSSGRVSYGTEAGHFQEAGVPGVIFGPGSIEQAHLPDEYISVEQMNLCSNFMTQLANWAENPGELVL